MQKKNSFLNRRTVLLAFALVLCAVLGWIVWRSTVGARLYTDADFGIASYRSAYDADGDGTDDQSDILAGARAYVAQKPRYQSKYYNGGYPDDGYGVCTDVVAFALRGAGYDLRELVDADIAAHGERYDIERADKNIDFRRVRNLRVYFEGNAISLTTDLSDPAAWQGGDIVVFEKHIGIVSDRRNRKGIPYLIHNAGQRNYEEDVLSRYKIVGHFRVS